MKKCLFLVCFRSSSGDEDAVVYRTSDLCKLFAEVIDLIGPDGCLLSVERIFVTDLDFSEV